MLKIIHREEHDASASEISSLKLELDTVLGKLRAVDDAFNAVSDEKLIEACIYEQKALMLRVEYLIELAASKGMQYDSLTELIAKGV